MKREAENKKNIFDNIFFKAAVLTTVVFIIGIAFGMWMDSIRLNEIESSIEEITIQWNDAKMQESYYNAFIDTPGFCDSAIEANLDFNEKIYEQGIKIERYEIVNKFTPTLQLEKKRYALLQTQFWMNSIHLREVCDVDYTTVVYLHSKNESFAINQKVQSAVLLDAKKACGNDIMLIPLPADLGIQTIEIVKSNFGIETFPSIIINENIVLQGLQTESDLAQYIDCING